MAGYGGCLSTPTPSGFFAKTPDERILIVVSAGPLVRGAAPGSLAARGLPETLYGNIDLTVTGGAIVLPSDGPAAGIWRLA